MKAEQKTWPNDWDIHLMKGFEFFFSCRTPLSIEFVLSEIMLEKYISGPFMINGDWRSGLDVDCSQVKIMLECGDREYCITMVRSSQPGPNGPLILGHVLNLQGRNPEMKPGQETVFIARDFYSAKSLDFFGANSVIECAEKVEEIISQDYWRNQGGEGDQGAPSPEVPNLPTGFQPLLV